MIHIEGMGVLGSLLALKLDSERIKFTWNDTNAPHAAWPACTGAIYPAGAERSIDHTGYALWDYELHTNKDSWVKPARKAFEAATYVFNHQRPPHEGKYGFDASKHYDLRFACRPSYHLNAQALVPSVRKLFADRQRPDIRKTDNPLIVAHGFGAQRSHAYWGWTRLVELDVKKSLLNELPPGQRPAFYFRQGRFVMAYAYPVPGTRFWYAGSSLIKQRTLRSLDIQSKYERWKQFFEELGDGAVKVKAAHQMIEGWRPAMDDPRVQHDKRKRIITMPSLWNSGVRHGLVYVDQVVKEIRNANYR